MSELGGKLHRVNLWPHVHGPAASDYVRYMMAVKKQRCVNVSLYSTLSHSTSNALGAPSTAKTDAF